METDNYVSKLNEYVQKEYYEMRYEDGGSVGPDQDKRWVELIATSTDVSSASPLEQEVFQERDRSAE